jgi:hypothetical protein
MKSRLSILLVICAATHLPTPAAAQRGFVGLGAGGSVIDLSTEQTEPHSRPSSTLRVGYGGQRVKVVLDWQRHGWGDDQVLTSDYQNGVQTRYPEVLRTDFLLLGTQINVVSGLYVRPMVGIGGLGAPAYSVPDGMNAESAEVQLGGAIAAGLSAGYQLRLHSRFALAIEASALRASPVEGTERRTIIGFQVVPLLGF